MTYSNDNDPNYLLRNPRKVVPPSERYGLEKWRRLPVEGQGIPVYRPFTITDWLLTAFGTAVLTYFILSVAFR